MTEVDADIEKLADIFKVSICKTDLDLNILEADSRLYHNFGYDKEDLASGLNVWRLVDNSQIDRLRSKVEEIQAGRKPEKECFIARRRDGSSLVCEFRLIPCHRGTKIIGFDAIFSDITEQINRQQLALIKHGQEWFNFLYHNMPGGIFLLNEQWKIKDVNDFAREILGYPQKDLQEESFERVSPGFVTLAQQELVKGQINNMEHSFFGKTGREIPVLTSLREFVIAGETLYLISFQDISSIIDLQKAMLTSEIKYRTLVETALEGIAITDISDNITFCNSAFARMLGYKQNYLAGANLTLIMDEVEFHRYKRLTQEKFRGGSGRYETILIGKNGECHHVMVAAAPFYAAGGEVIGTFGVVHDISEMKEKEILLKRQKADLKRLSNRLLEIQETERKNLARELHDVIGQKLALAKMRLSRITLEMEAGDTGLLKEISGLISELADNVRHLSSELRPRILDDLGLIPTMEWYLDEFCRECGIKCHLTVKGEPSPLTKMQDINIFRLFQEAMLNIQKHSSAGQAEIIIEFSPEVLNLRISDNGKGFVPEKIGNGFVSRPGLGLLNIRERMDMIGGRTDIASRPGEGTTVTAILPLR
ncbi:hypothetical protein TRIP_C20945 [Candidatus Zixiibacteriota bacterium]|nr:hypothetical protein TRIP_C20945 [candidate division Zixibacteria bacterium]